MMLESMKKQLHDDAVDAGTNNKNGAPKALAGGVEGAVQSAAADAAKALVGSAKEH